MSLDSSCAPVCVVTMGKVAEVQKQQRGDSRDSLRQFAGAASAGAWRSSFFLRQFGLVLLATACAPTASPQKAVAPIPAASVAGDVSNSPADVPNSSAHAPNSTADDDPKLPRDLRPPICRLASHPPDELQLDGQLDEWSEEDIDRSSVASVTAVLHPAGLHVAAHLYPPFDEGTWLRVTFPREPGPRFGHVSFAAGGIANADCRTGYGMGSGEMNSAERAYCERAYLKYKDQYTRYVRSLSAWYRVDQGGVQRLHPTDGLVPVQGAQLATRPDAGATSIELSLPALSLPRAARAPVQEIVLEVRATSTLKSPPSNVEDEPLFELAEPIEFAPDGAVRSIVWAQRSVVTPMDACSYQPGDDSPIHFIEYANGAFDNELDHAMQPLSIEEVQRPLLRPLIEHAGKRIVVSALEEAMLLREGQPPEPLMVVDAKAVVRKHHGEAFLLQPKESWAPDSHRSSASWRVAILHSDGSLSHFSLWPKGLEFGGGQEATVFHEHDYAVLGVAMVLDDGSHRRYRWSYDARSRTFRGLDSGAGVREIECDPNQPRCK